MGNIPVDYSQRQSIKSRYLQFAALVATIFIIGAIFSSLHIKNVAHENAESLEFRDTATILVDKIRQAIWYADSTLNTTLITPHVDHDATIKEHISQAEEKLGQLARLKSMETAGLTNILSDLETDLANLKFYLLMLLEKNNDPNWVYPMLPYINETLLESNTAFESAALLSLQEIAEEEDGIEYGSNLYREIAQIRDLWRQLILNFRAVIIRFAGLNRVERIAQEQNIDILYGEITKRLIKFESLKDQHQFGFETEESLTIMLDRSKKWYSDFQELKKIRDSKIWRADINYIDGIIRPIQADIAVDLTTLEDSIYRWSSQNTKAMENVAIHLSFELWGLTGFALIFVWIIYLMISRSVLTPIAQIATAISTDINKIDGIKSMGKSSREVHTLVNAFNTMRSQIQHRQLALEHQALHDSLTGLPNRALLHDRIEQTINIANREKNNIAIMLLDLDRFKDINDTLGHAVGDLVLQEISVRLASCLRTSDTIARLGGDEFAIICPNIKDKEITPFIEKILNCTNQVISIKDHNLYTGVSVGVSLYPENADNAPALIRLADIAMYSAKQKGIGYDFYNSELDTLNADNLSLLGDLREELKNPTGQLDLYYQPKLNMKSKQISGAEALLRWNHPDKGFIPPDEIIHMSEQTKLIDELTFWVIERAIQDHIVFNNNEPEMNISINLSVRNLQNPDLPELIQKIISKHNMNSQHLTFEITESAIMSDPVRAREILDSLSSMGISLDVDDYGTGFSSLAYLKIIPVNGLKIDKSFVIDLLDDENDLTIVRSTIELGHNLHLNVTAEGVETAEIYRHLEKNRCDFAQGAYIACPMPVDEFQKWCKAFDPDTL